MDINELLREFRVKLGQIFVDHTAYYWKNSWQHESDRCSKKLTIDNPINNHNIFLLTNEKLRYRTEIKGPFELSVCLDYRNYKDIIRVDIKYNGRHKYYFIDNELEWLKWEIFLIDLCKTQYELNVKLRESLNMLDIPNFINSTWRDKLLSEILL